MKIILITGASSGLGYDCAKRMAQLGNKVYGCARNVKKIEELKNIGVTPMYLDLEVSETIDDCIEKVLEIEGKIDVLINNAGYGSYGPLETVNIGEAKKQFEVNIFGLAYLTQKVVPHMRSENSGLIINISSMGGRLVTYFGGWYHATKYALEAYSDALRMEVKQFGIKVAIIEPGGIKTKWGIIAAKNLGDSTKGTIYEKEGLRVSKSMEKQYEGKLLSSTNVVIDAIEHAIYKRTKSRYLVGFGAKSFVFLKTILPTSIYDKIMKTIV